eukprot:COSAG04_NODE_24446_length_322_cov_0.461883_1_plen_103_part_10
MGQTASPRTFACEDPIEQDENTARTLAAAHLQELRGELQRAAAVLAERLAKEHKELLTVMKAATNRMVGELVDEAKQGLHTRHNWRAAEVVKKLEGAQMAARS